MAVKNFQSKEEVKNVESLVMSLLETGFIYQKTSVVYNVIENHANYRTIQFMSFTYINLLIK